MNQPIKYATLFYNGGSDKTLISAQQLEQIAHLLYWCDDCSGYHMDPMILVDDSDVEAEVSAVLGLEVVF